MEINKVIVLILSYNGKHLLEDSISSYLANGYQNFEVVVIDNGSVDGTKEWVGKNYPGVIVLRTDINLGYSGGFNLGLKYAFNNGKADFVVITNNDVKADSNVISELVKVALTDKSVGFVTGKVYYYDTPNVFQTIGKYEDPITWNGNHIGRNEADVGQYEEITERVFADDVFTLVSKELYADIGGYDTTFFLQGEEYDWQARAKAKGYKIIYTPFAKLWHKESMTIGKRSPLKAYFDARNPGIVLLKHKSPVFFKKYLWNHFLKYILKGSVKSLLKGDLLISIALWRGFFSMLVYGFRNKKFSVSHFF